MVSFFGFFNKKTQKDSYNFLTWKNDFESQNCFRPSILKQLKAENGLITIFKVYWPCLLTTKLSCLQKNQSGQTKLVHILLTILWKGCRMNVKVNVSDSNFSPSIANFSKSASCKATLCNISVKFATLFVFANATIQVVLAAFGTWQ